MSPWPRPTSPRGQRHAGAPRRPCFPQRAISAGLSPLLRGVQHRGSSAGAATATAMATATGTSWPPARGEDKVPSLLSFPAPRDGRRGSTTQRGWMHFGALQPTRDPHPQPGRVTCRNRLPQGWFLSDQLQHPRAKHTTAAQATQGRDGHRCQGHFGDPQPQNPAPAPGSRRLLRRSPPVRLLSPSTRSLGRTPDPRLNAQNCRNSTNNRLRSAVPGTFPARAPEVAPTADSHQRNFQK